MSQSMSRIISCKKGWSHALWCKSSTWRSCCVARRGGPHKGAGILRCFGVLFSPTASCQYEYWMPVGFTELPSLNFRFDLAVWRFG